MRQHQYECTEKGITYTMKDNRLYRIYPFYGMMVYMPMNSVEEEINKDKEILLKYGNKMPCFPSISETTDADEMRDLEYNNMGRTTSVPQMTNL